MKTIAFSLLKKLSFLLKNIDLFGRKTQLNVNHHSKYKTRIGGVFSLAMILLSLFLFMNLGSDMIYRENAKVIFSEIFSRNPEKTTFSKENYFFMFGVEYLNFTHFIDESVYTVNVINKKISNNDKNSFEIVVPTERCTEAHFPEKPNMHDYFMRASRSPINELICIKDIEKYFIEGSFDSENFAYFEINIKICENKTDENAPICKSAEIIKENMSGFFAFYSMDYLVDPKNFENPGQLIGIDYFSPIGVGMKKNNYRLISTTKIYSDDAKIFNSRNYNFYPTYAEDKETLLFDTANKGVLMSFALRKYHNEKIYERKYKTFQQVLSEMGGIIQILYLVFYVLSSPFISKLYFEKIINSIYNFEDDHDAFSKINETIVSKNKEKSMNDFVSNHLSSLQKNHRVNLNFIKGNTKKDLEKKKEKFLKYRVHIKNKSPLKATLCDFFRRPILFLKRNFDFSNRIRSESEIKTPLTNKLKRLKKGKDLIKEKLNISYILQKLYEIDKFKMLLLNENQFHLFEYLPKPVILKNNQIDLGNSKHFKFISYETDTVGKAKRMYTAYQNINNQNELSVMDKKLIDLLDDNLKQILEVF